MTTLPIDGEKFLKVITERFGSLGDCSVQSGHKRNYCADIRRNSRITNAFLVFLADRGITYDDIKPDESEPEHEHSEENGDILTENLTISMQNLSEVIAVAIYTAFVNLHKDKII